MRTEDLTVTTGFPVVGRGLFRGDLDSRADTLTERQAPVRDQRDWEQTR